MLTTEESLRTHFMLFLPKAIRSFIGIIILMNCRSLASCQVSVMIGHARGIYGCHMKCGLSSETSVSFNRWRLVGRSSSSLPLASHPWAMEAPSAWSGYGPQCDFPEICMLHGFFLTKKSVPTLHIYATQWWMPFIISGHSDILYITGKNHGYMDGNSLQV